MFSLEDLISVKPVIKFPQFPIVIDNFLTFDKYQELINFVFNSDWQFGWRTLNILKALKSLDVLP